jgi:hypothetical protein
MRVMAKELADRIVRYRSGAKARYALPITEYAAQPYLLDGKAGGIGTDAGWAALTPAQQSRASAAQTMEVARITLLNHRDPLDDPESPVVLIGHSYLLYFREQFIREINQLIRTCPGRGASMGLFGDLLREPELLDGTQVLVWITTPEHMAQFKPPAAVRGSGLQERLRIRRCITILGNTQIVCWPLTAIARRRSPPLPQPCPKP